MIKIAKNDGSVIIDTLIDTKGFGKGAASLKSQFGGLGSTFKKLGGIIAAAFSVKAIGDFAKDCLDLGSDLQEVQNVVDVTFTTMNEQVNEFAKNAARTAGLSETMAKKYTGTFGAMAKSFKFTEEEAYNMATALTQMSGDVASFYNLSQDQAYTKLKSVFTGETESLKDLGVVMTQSALDSYALANGFGKTTSQMTEQEKVALRYRFVMDQLSGASGDFARTSGSWANQTKLLALQFDSLKASIGQGLINVLTPAIKMLNTLMSKLQVVADAFRDFTTSLFGSAGGGATDAAKGLEEAAQGAENLAENTEEAGKAAKKALAGFDELNVIQSGNESGGSAAGVGLAGGLSVGTVTVGGDVQDGVSPQVQGILDTALEKIRGFGAQISAAFQPSISSWGEAFSSLPPAVQDTASRVGTSLSTLWNDSLAPFGAKIATEWIPSITNTFSETFAHIFADVLPFAMDTWATGFENTCLKISELTTWLDEVFSGLLPTVQDTMSRSGLAISDLWNNSLAPFAQYIALDFVPGIAGAFGETLAPIFEDAMPFVLDSFATDFENSCKTVEEATGWLKTAFEGVKTVFVDMCESISSNWDEYGGSLLQGFTDFKDGLWETWWYIYDNIIDPVLTACSETLSWLWDEHLKPLWDNVVEFAMSICDNVLALWNGFIKPLIDYLVAILAPVVTNVINGIVDAVAIVIAVVSDVIGGVLKFLDGLIQFIVGVFTLDWKRAWGGVVKMFEGLWNGLSGIVKGVVNAIIWVINQLIAAIYSGIAGVVNGLGNVVSTVGKLIGQDWGFSIPTVAPTIPYLAQGAVIPPNAPFMAVLGDQRHGTNIEAPLTTIQEAVAIVMEDMIQSNIAGHEATVAVLQQILEAVYGIDTSDGKYARAVERYQQKMAIVRGG